MKLTAKVKLKLNDEQREQLRLTMERANAACNWISQEAFNSQTFRQFSLHKRVYKPAREQFDLSAQMVVRCIAKVADGYKISIKKQRGFKKHGAIAYDSRILSWQMKKRQVSIWSLDGRLKIPFVCGARDWELLQTQRGETDLCFVKGDFYLFTTCDVDTPDPMDVAEYIGVDLGQVNIATDSDGNQYSGSQVLSLRNRRFRQRKRLQSKGTKSAKRVLRRLSGRERRMMTQENHRISKQIVELAKRTCRGIRLEDLSGIRDRVRVRKQQRRQLHGWAFYQLRQFVEYKAKLAGVPVELIDPAYTSRTCSECGFCAKHNRTSQSNFSCRNCGYTANADYNASRNIAVWADRNAAVQLAPLG